MIAQTVGHNIRELWDSGDTITHASLRSVYRVIVEKGFNPPSQCLVIPTHALSGDVYEMRVS